MSAQPPRRLILVSYRLPFRVVDGVLVRNAGGLVSALLAYALGGEGQRSVDELVWMGCSTDSDEALASAHRPDEFTKLRLVRVALPDDVDQAFYGGFCNDLLWPLFHYFPSFADFSPAWWQAYQTANQLFAGAVTSMAGPEDTVWIHDYHFLLLPRLLRSLLPKAAIGFFLHIPFPDFELLRVIPRSWLQALLDGLLGADLVGLHTADYVVHLREAMARALQAEVRPTEVWSNGHATRLDAFPIAIDMGALAELAGSPEVAGIESAHRTALGDVRVVVSVDRMDYAKGLLARLRGIERFLRAHPEWHERVVFHMLAVPSRDAIAQYQNLRHDLEAHVGRINGLFATLHWRPIAYQYRSVSLPELVAIYRVGDVCLITALRDGMNLVAKEYVAVQTPERCGVLVLSERAGAASELDGALLVNPNDEEELATTIHGALTLQADDRRDRWERMLKRLRSHDVFDWARDFLGGLEAARRRNAAAHAVGLEPAVREALLDAFAAASQRVLLLDHDGTLAELVADPAAARPRSALLRSLEALTSQRNTAVWIISGRDRAFLQGCYGGLAIGLVAEHGAFVRPPGGSWQAQGVPRPPWWPAVVASLQVAARRCPGAWLEEKETALVWHYRKADPQLAALRRAALEVDLGEHLRNQSDWTLVSGHRIVEVRPVHVDKGAAARRILAERHGAFVLCAGDDRTDEDLFRAAPVGGWTFRVGIGKTHARHQLRDPAEMRALLAALAARATGSEAQAQASA